MSRSSKVTTAMNLTLSVVLNEFEREEFAATARVVVVIVIVVRT